MKVNSIFDIKDIEQAIGMLMNQYDFNGQMIAKEYLMRFNNSYKHIGLFLFMQ